jgi:hypothetical protein
MNLEEIINARRDQAKEAMKTPNKSKPNSARGIKP